jgi:hypothetical protein
MRRVGQPARRFSLGRFVEQACAPRITMQRHAVVFAVQAFGYSAHKKTRGVEPRVFI